MKRLSEITKLPLPIVISNLFQVYVAQDAAVKKHFGSRSWERAFRIDAQKGLIVDDTLSEMTRGEIDQEIEAMKERYRAAGYKKEKGIHLTQEEAALLARRL